MLFHQPRVYYEDPSSSRSYRSSYSSATGGYRTTSNAFVPPGMSEEEQLRRATEESLRETRNSSYSNSRSHHFYERTSNPTAPPYPTDDFHSPRSPPYPVDPHPLHPDSETLRRLRRQRYENFR